MRRWCFWRWGCSCYLWVSTLFDHGELFLMLNLWKRAENVFCYKGKWSECRRMLWVSFVRVSAPISCTACAMWYHWTDVGCQVWPEEFLSTHFVYSVMSGVSDSWKLVRQWQHSFVQWDEHRILNIFLYKRFSHECSTVVGVTHGVWVSSKKRLCLTLAVALSLGSDVVLIRCCDSQSFKWHIM